MAMINAWSAGTKPWSFPEVEQEVKNITLLRMRLIPYFYSEFAKYHFNGTPPFRAMILEPGFGFHNGQEMKNEGPGENPNGEMVSKEMKDQYMAGEFLLVAPIFKGKPSREVLLPEGNWYDFYTGEFAGGGEIITVKAEISKIPVFVKDGGIVPMMPPMLHVPASGQKIDLEIRYYGSKPGSYLLYDDDGETFDYEKGEYSWRTISVGKDRQGKFTGTISDAEKGKPDNIGKISRRMMSGHSR